MWLWWSYLWCFSFNPNLVVWMPNPKWVMLFPKNNQEVRKWCCNVLLFWHVTKTSSKKWHPLKCMLCYKNNVFSTNHHYFLALIQRFWFLTLNNQSYSRASKWQKSHPIIESVVHNCFIHIPSSSLWGLCGLIKETFCIGSATGFLSSQGLLHSGKYGYIPTFFLALRFCTTSVLSTIRICVSRLLSDQVYLGQCVICFFLFFDSYVTRPHFSSDYIDDH